MPTHPRSVFQIALMLALLVYPDDAGAETNPKRIYQRVLPSVMTLEVENQVDERFIGSAVMALADDIAITAWHVVSDARVVSACFADGTRVPVVGYLDRDWQRDLVLVKLARPLRGRRATVDLSLMPVASRAYVIGAPKGLGFSISDGLVSQLRTVDGFAQYQVSCPISPGNSGGPLLNERGRVAGIVSWTKSDAQNVSFVVPCLELRRLNPQAAVVTLNDPSQRAALPTPARQLHSDLPVVKTSSDTRVGGFGQFATLMERLVGQRITVGIRTNGQENTFTFTVPPGSWR
ncbi:MAG: trypsin-like peptidase domain-containing protein [Verrucomicrobiales bacterium]|nr:trypsin-like peptidase domain-containing protein [Verrucomicrobiales bacterium]